MGIRDRVWPKADMNTMTTIIFLSNIIHWNSWPSMLRASTSSYVLKNLNNPDFGCSHFDGSPLMLTDEWITSIKRLSILNKVFKKASLKDSMKRNMETSVDTIVVKWSEKDVVKISALQLDFLNLQNSLKSSIIFKEN